MMIHGSKILSRQLGEMDVDSAEDSNDVLHRRRMQLDTLDEDDSADEIPEW